jgi:predicted Zn-dependent peptidase
MSLTRTIRPEFHQVDRLYFPDYHIIDISFGLKLYSLEAGTLPVCRLELVFDAGLAKQVKIAQASFTSSMLSEGTQNKTALALAESLDFYGSYFQTRSNADDCVATLYCLDKHLKNCLPLFLEALTDSIFPQKELDIQKKNAIQKLVVNEKKNSYLCRKLYYKNIYGEGHPYASFSEKRDIESLSREDLSSFYSKNILGGLKYALLSGKFSKASQTLILEQIKQAGFTSVTNPGVSMPITTKSGQHFFEKKDSVQSAIRIGKVSISRNHGDFRKLQFLNLIFGGYFGSRLMKNIREDKGLTYGIYSVLEPLKDASNWYIDSEINNKNREQGITEIYKELDNIRRVEIPEEELNTARNYYLGSFLRGLDGPFSLADRLKIMIDYKLPNNYYPEFVATLNNTTSQDLLETANKYFDPNNIVEVIIGKK